MVSASKRFKLPARIHAQHAHNTMSGIILIGNEFRYHNGYGLTERFDRFGLRSRSGGTPIE